MQNSFIETFAKRLFWQKSQVMQNSLILKILHRYQSMQIICSRLATTISRNAALIWRMSTTSTL